MFQNGKKRVGNKWKRENKRKDRLVENKKGSGEKGN